MTFDVNNKKHVLWENRQDQQMVQAQQVNLLEAIEEIILRNLSQLQKGKSKRRGEEILPFNSLIKINQIKN